MPYWLQQMAPATVHFPIYQDYITRTLIVDLGLGLNRTPPVPDFRRRILGVLLSKDIGTALQMRPGLF